MFLRSSSTLSDQELLAAYREGSDLEALGKLYTRYMDLVYGVCIKYLQNDELSRDAVMQIFEELVVKLKKHQVDNFRSWLHTVARNHCLMYLRSNKSRKTVEISDSIMQSEQELHLNGELQKEAEFRRLEGCINKLSAEQKQAVELFYLQQKSYHEIAASTGQEWNKIRSLIQNGRRNLKICMDQQEHLTQQNTLRH